MGKMSSTKHKEISSLVALKISDFYFGDSSGDIFSKWLYSFQQAESELGTELFTEIASCDFSDDREIDDTRRILKAALGDRLYKERAISVAKRMLNGEIDMPGGCRKLADLSMDAEEIVPVVFVGYASELDRLGDTGHYNERIRSDLEKLLRSLSSDH